MSPPVLHVCASSNWNLSGPTDLGLCEQVLHIIYYILYIVHCILYIIYYIWYISHITYHLLWRMSVAFAVKGLPITDRYLLRRGMALQLLHWLGDRQCWSAVPWALGCRAKRAWQGHSGDGCRKILWAHGATGKTTCCPTVFAPAKSCDFSAIRKAQAPRGRTETSNDNHKT